MGSDDEDFTIIGRPGMGAKPSGEAVLGHYLVAISGADLGRIVEVAAEAITVGRDAKQTLVFADTELSRRHARISRLRDQVIVEDFQSTNGTFVDTVRIDAPVVLREGAIVQFGQQAFKYERRDRRDVQRGEELSRDLLRASSYALSLLPAPVESGPVRAAWRFLPSAHLGGDAFGYHWLDPDTFVMYLVDVSGHGVGAAMHSVSVMNVLRQQALPGVDFSRPAQVLTSLNNRFQMDSHDGMYFTIWYGVYRQGARTITYSTAGHHAAYLVPPDRREAAALIIPHLMIGALPDATFEEALADVAPDSSLYVFSDGVFEIMTADERQWSQADFLPHVLAPPVAGISEPDRLYQVVRNAARPGLLDDDFSLVTFEFQ